VMPSDHGLRRRADCGELLIDMIGMTRTGHDDRRCERLAMCSSGGQLQHRFLGGQREQLLGHRRTRHRPQAVPDPPERITGTIVMMEGALLERVPLAKGRIAETTIVGFYRRAM
jgi:hypothetical protein